MNEELKIIISAEIAELKKNVQAAQKEIKDLSKNGESNFKKFSNAAGATGRAVGGAMKMTAAAIAAGAAAIIGLAESTREYRTEQAKLVSAFETAGASAKQAKDTYNDLYRVLGDSGQATEAANHLSQLTTDQKELSEWANICQGVYATFGDSLPIESLTEAANETAKTGEITGALADALNWAGVNEDEFAESLFWCNTEAEREELIRNTLNGLYDEASQKYEENAKSVLAANEATAAMTEALAALGEAVEPIVTILKQGFADTLKELIPSIQLVSQGLQDMFSGTEGGAEKLKEGITSLITTAVEKITSLLPSFLGIGTGIISALVESISASAPSLVGALGTAITQLAEALPSLLKSITDILPSLLETVLTELIALTPIVIESIIDMFVVLCESIDSILKPVIDALPELIIAIIDGLMSNFDKILGGIITLIIAIVDNIPYLLEKLIDALPTVISLIIVGLINSLPQLIGGLLKISLSVAKSIPTILKAPLDIAVGVFKGIWEAIKQIFSNIGSWFKNKFGEGVNGIKNAFSSIGSFFKGIWKDIKNIFSNVGATIGNAITNTVKKAVNGVLSTAVKIINGFINAINFAIDIINKIPAVNISKINTLSVPKMARGGVVDSATLAIVGEQGKEAVVPLENNTEWIDMLAAKINSAKGGSTPIILQVDGKTFAQTAVNSINDLTRARGSLQLKLV